MSVPAVLGTRAEAALRLLNLTLGLHRAQAVPIRSSPDSTRLAAPAFDGLQVQRQATFLRMISIAEAFCVDRLLELAEVDVAPSGNVIRTIVWDKASSSAVGTWTSIQDTYKNWYDVKPSWTAMNQLIEVRNAIAHGLGQLTRVQRIKLQSTTSKIVAAKIRLDGDRIVLEESNMQDVRGVCVNLISEVDRLVQAKTGDIS
jgi:hypothetical protein